MAAYGSTTSLLSPYHHSGAATPYRASSRRERRSHRDDAAALFVAAGRLALGVGVAAEELFAEVVAGDDCVDVEGGGELVEIDVGAVFVAQLRYVFGALGLGALLDLVVIDGVDGGLGAH